MEKLVLETGITDSGYSCVCEALPGFVVAGGKDFAEFAKEVRESVDFYVECAKADGTPYPAILDGDYELEFKFNVMSLLQHYRGILSLSALERLTGINRKQLSHYAVGSSRPRRKQADRINLALRNFARELSVVSV